MPWCNSMKIRQERADDRACFTLAGRLDALSAGTLRERLSAAMDEGARRLELDMDGVDFMSSVGIRVLQECALRLAKIKGSLRVTKASRFVREMLEIVGLYELLAPVMAKPTVESKPFAIAASGLHGELTRLDATARLRMEQAGPDGMTYPFPNTTFSIGFGSLSPDGNAPSADRCGTILSAAGYAVFSCPDELYVPDYMIYAEEFVPRLFLLSGRRWAGDFACFIDFSTEGSDGIDLGTLGQQLLDLSQTNNLGVVLIGEASGVAGFRLMPRPREAEPGRESRAHDESVLLVAGWIAREAAGQINAAVFSHAPLRRGQQKLDDAIAAVFEQPLIDVLQLSPATRLKRGAIWLTPFDTGGAS